MSSASSSTAPGRKTTTAKTTSSSPSSPSSKGSSTSPRLFSRASASTASAASAQDITAHADSNHFHARSDSRSQSQSQSQSQPQSQSQSQSHSHSHLQPSLPSAETERHIAQARAAVVASIGNLLDTELQSRAQMLHDNASALDKQEKDVVRATEGLRRETGRLAREADAAARKLKEVGNVQNWAEVLERGFLVLEETVRLANGGAGAGGTEDGSGTCSCDCSQCGGLSGGEEEEDDDDDEVDANQSERQGQLDSERADVDMGIDEVSNDADAGNASRNTMGRVKESEMASVVASVSTT